MSSISPDTSNSSNTLWWLDDSDASARRSSAGPRGALLDRARDRRHAEAGERPLEHVPLEERRHPPLEQLGVVVEHLARAVEIFFARAHRLQLVLPLAVALGQAIQEAVDHRGRVYPHTCASRGSGCVK
jgi:hypothetical protein